MTVCWCESAVEQTPTLRLNMKKAAPRKRRSPSRSSQSAEVDPPMCTSDGIVPGSAQGPILRPYQTAVIGDVEAEVAAGKKRVIIVAATAAGKTVIAAEIIARRSRPGGGRSSWLTAAS